MKSKIRAICAINAHKILAAPIIIGMMYWSTTGVRKPYLYGYDAESIVISAYVDAFNRGDIEGVSRLFSPDAEIFGVLARGGLDKAIPIWEQLIRWFRINLCVKAMVAEGNFVAVRFVERGTSNFLSLRVFV